MSGSEAVKAWTWWAQRSQQLCGENNMDGAFAVIVSVWASSHSWCHCPSSVPVSKPSLSGASGSISKTSWRPLASSLMFPSLIRKNQIITTLTSRGLLLSFHKPPKATLQRTLQQLHYCNHLCIPVNASCEIDLFSFFLLNTLSFRFKKMARAVTSFNLKSNQVKWENEASTIESGVPFEVERWCFKKT